MKTHELAEQLPDIVAQARRGEPLSDDVAMWFLSAAERRLDDESRQSLIRSRLGIFPVFCVACRQPGFDSFAEDQTEWFCPKHRTVTL